MPAPLTPPDCDMGGLYLPLQVHRLLHSRLWLKARRDKAIAFAAVSLWCESWQQVPAASLPDDDELLAELAGCDAGEWARVKPHVMRLYVLCSDGRLYHRVVADQALIAWKTRATNRQRAREGAAARWGGNGPGGGGDASSIPGASGKQAASNAAGASDKHASSNGQAMLDDASGNAGLGLGLGLGENNTSEPWRVRPPAVPAAAPPTPRDVVFNLGTPLLTQAGVTERRARAMLALVAKLHGDDAVVDALNDCARDRPIDPVSWLQAKLGPRSNGTNKSEARYARNLKVAHDVARQFDEREAKGKP